MIEVIAILILLAIAAAIIVVETTNLLFSVISVGAVGFLLAIIFLLLGAPDVAIVQIGVEIISLVILVRATIGRDVEPALGHRGLIGMIMAVTLVVAIGLFGLQIFADFPEFGSSVMERVAQAPSNTYLREALASTGTPNTVTAVLLDYRAYDTLGEVTVLFCAVIGVLAILRCKARVRPAGDEAEEGRK